MDSSPPETIRVIRCLLVTYQRRHQRYPRDSQRPFGLLELFVCIDNCLRQTKKILVFPHESGLNHSIEPIIQTMDFLGASKALYRREALSESS